MANGLQSDFVHSNIELMPSTKPWLEGPSAKDRAIAKMWQGGPLLLIGVISTAGTAYFLGIVWIWTVLIGIAGPQGYFGF